MVIRWLFIVCLIFSSVSFAAVERRLAVGKKLHQYVQHGTIAGGEAGTAFTLLNIRRIDAKKDKIERLIFDLGDAYGKPLNNHVSYFHASVDPAQKRVIVDFSQMIAAGVNEATLRQRFKGSQLVKDVKINFDPIDKTITVQLLLKDEVQIEAFQLPAKDSASRMVLDLKSKI